MRTQDHANSQTNHLAGSRAQITARGLTIVRGARTIIYDLDLTITGNSRLAIVGENGRGKTTLLAALTGDLLPRSGDVHRQGAIAVAEQEMPTDDGQTVASAVAFSIRESTDAIAALDLASTGLAIGRPEAEREYEAALEVATRLDAWDAERRVTRALAAVGAETRRDRPLAELSVGQRYRVRLACVLGGDAELLLLDEPTNHLDAEGLTYLTSALRARGGFALVSHDRQLLGDAAEQFLDLDATSDGRARLFGGGYDAYLASKSSDRERWAQLHESQQATARQLQLNLDAAQARLSTGWRPDKGTGKHQRASRAPAIVQSVRRRQDALDAATVPVPEPPLRFALPQALGRVRGPLLVATNVAVEGRLLESVSLRVTAGGRLLVRGPNGAGKSTLLGVLAESVPPTEGQVWRHPSARVELLSQETALNGSLTAAELYRERAHWLEASGVLPRSGSVGLRALGLLSERERASPVRELSVGQQRRLALALALVSQPDLLLLDEPSNHLSLALVEDLLAGLEATSMAVIVSTHDRGILGELSHWPAVQIGVIRPNAPSRSSRESADQRTGNPASPNK